MTTYNLRKGGRLYDIEVERDDYASMTQIGWTATVTQQLGSVTFLANKTQNEDPTGLLNEIFDKAEELIVRINGTDRDDAATPIPGSAH